MANITIKIEDIDGGKVRITSTPNFETMVKMEISGEKLTGAHGYAFSTLNHLWKLSKQKGPTILEIPKIGW